MINNMIYQKIFDEIYEYLGPDWDKVVIYLEYGEASYSIEFFIKSKGAYRKCYDLPWVNEDDLFDAFANIDSIVSPERKGKDLWSNMTMIVDRDGRMHCDFDYTDLSECAYQYKEDWKKQYLV